MGIKRAIGATGNYFDNVTPELDWSLFEEACYNRMLSKMEWTYPGYFGSHALIRHREQDSKSSNISPLNHELGWQHKAACAAQAASTKQSETHTLAYGTEDFWQTLEQFRIGDGCALL